MKHQERTADSNYVIKWNTDRATRAHVQMSDIIQESGASPRKQQALSPHSTNNDEDDDMPLGIVFAGTPATPSNEEWGTPSILLTVFQPEISTGKLPTLQDEEQSCAAHLCGTARFFETHS